MLPEYFLYKLNFRKNTLKGLISLSSLLPIQVLKSCLQKGNFLDTIISLISIYRLLKYDFYVDKIRIFQLQCHQNL